MRLSRFFNLDGRIGRGEFWFAVVKAVLVCFVAGLIFMWLGWTSRTVETGTIQYDGGSSSAFHNEQFVLNPLGNLVLYAVWLLLLLPASIRRRHDRGAVGLDVYVLSAVNILTVLTGLSAAMGSMTNVLNIASTFGGIYLLIVLGILHGTRGPNAFGPDPRAEALASVTSASEPPDQ